MDDDNDGRTDERRTARYDNTNVAHLCELKRMLFK